MTGRKIKGNLGKWGRGRKLQLLWESTGESLDSVVGVSGVHRHGWLLQSAEAPVRGFESWGDFHKALEDKKC